MKSAQSLLPNRVLNGLQRLDAPHGNALSDPIPDAFASRTLTDIYNQQVASPYSPFTASRREKIYIYINDPAHLTGKHTHDSIEIVFLCEGEIINHIDEDALSMRQGDVCLVGVGAQHEFDAKHCEATVISIVMIHSLFEDSLGPYLRSEGRIPQFLRSQGSEHYLYFAFQAHSPLQRILRDIIDEYTFSGFQQSFALEAHLLLLFSEMERQGATRWDNQGAFTEIMDYIMEHCTHETLNDIARHFNYTPNYFSRLIKIRTGRNCKEVMKETRLQIALNLLVHEELSTDEIAERIGYGSTSHFFKVFKEQYGITPKQYRDSMIP